ncbi:hypothetical protein BYT27DRAFT_6766911 [Phlegmacium glaucopus]|nr:hypothetical protein BYT27DRAFT_6766911 [Phlegmacium glaucopus]
MFSFLSNWRQAFSSSDGESDDVSSLNRSLSLPWPVTQSSPRTNKNEGTSKQQQQPVNGMNMRDISYPMPKMALKALTRPDDHPTAGLPGPSVPPATSGTIGTPSLHPFIAAPTPTSGSVPWSQESAAKRRDNNYNLRTALLQANAYAYTTNAPPLPEVVRLDNNSEMDPRSQPSSMEASTNHHAYAYANGISNQYADQTPHDEDDGEHEIYTSPFERSDEDDEDDFFYGPPPKQSTTISSTSRWGGLKLHTASPFSQSTLRVDGLIFPPPPDTSPHRTLPLSTTAAGVFPPSLQPGTPPLPTVNTDVYNHAYNYPLAKQLSPIAEQDYFSPVSVRGLPASAASASPGADSVLHFGFVNGNGSGRTITEGDKSMERERDLDRGSIRTRSLRAGSVESTKGPAMTSVSRSGSLSMSMRDPNPSPSGSTIGSEIIRPSPIYASPFITRHLNRTISQTSSNKSESPLQAQFQPPPPPPPPPSPLSPAPVPAPPVTQSQSQPQPQGETQSNSSSTPTLSRMTSWLSIGSKNLTPRLSTVTITPANAYLKLSGPDTNITTVQTPTSAVTTTTGTMYTPNSAFPAPTPTTPTLATMGITGIQIPAPAITILPCIPPLDFRPCFPGPHPSPNLSTDSGVPRLRPPKMGKKKGDAGHRLSVIRGSGIESGGGDTFTRYEEEILDDEEEGGGYDVESLHADSFVTATTNSSGDEDEDEDKPMGRGVELTNLAKALSHSGSGNSTTGDSFITRRWDRDAALGLSLSLSPTTFRERKHQFFSSKSSFIANLTPAFWAFWLGFIFPVLWLVGGWHFTSLGEQPPKSTVWEWYFWRMRDGWGVFWKRVFVGWCCGMRKGVENHNRGSRQQQQTMQMQQGPQRRIPPRTQHRTRSVSYSHSKLRSGKVFPALPRWVAEKQSTDDGRMRLNDPKRSMKGISFGYPFIPRPPYSQESTLSSSTTSLSVAKKVLVWIEKPNRMLDQLYGIKLREVRGRPESGRRMFDPWIQRCRYAFCWMMLVVAIGLCTASIYLIVVNTRRL